MEILVGVAGLVAVVGLFLMFGRKNKLEPGLVRLMLDSLGDDYAVFNDVVVEVQNGMSRIDFVVVSPYGVFVIDIKQETGKIFGEVGQQEWRVFKKETIYNPIWRNRTHLNGLEKLLGSSSYLSLVVFLNARLKSDFGPHVVELAEMLPFVRGYQRQAVEPGRLDAIIDILEKKQTEK